MSTTLPLDQSSGAHSRWIAATAYPKGTMPGLGLIKLAEELQLRSSGSISLSCNFNEPFEASSMLQDVAAGRLEIADLYCGALSKVDRVFQIGSLPFQASTPASAMQLLAAARSAYQLKFAEFGVHLLYVSPWPPTGLWTRKPIERGPDFAGLRIRTYDDMSEAVVRLAGGQAQQMPFGEALEQLRVGGLDGVLSSGDGEAGQRLAKHLRYFHDVRYATPISFTVLGTKLYHAMDENRRECMDAAARAVEGYLWNELAPRMQRNLDSMLACGVQVIDDVPLELKSAMRRSGHQVTQRWEQMSPKGLSNILSGYFPSPQGR